MSAGPERAPPALQQLTDELHASDMRHRRLFEAVKDGILTLEGCVFTVELPRAAVSSAALT